MRVSKIMWVAAVAVLPLAIALAAQATRQYGPFPSGSPDSGTCGNMWADDTFERFFKVDARQKADGTYDVVEQFKNGTFVTRAGASPGGCEAGNPIPPTISAGIQGKMQGQFWIRVSNGVFNPNANPGTMNTAQFIQAVFGPSATYQVYSFSLNYSAKNRGDWRNASSDKGGNHGDIR